MSFHTNKQNGMALFAKLVFFFFILLILAQLSLPPLTHAAEFFVTESGSGTCDQNSPCNLQTALGMAGDGDTIYVKGGETYYGTGDNVIEITDSINLLGGWDGSPTGGIVRNPDAYVTTLDGGETRRVIHISGSGESPTIKGFTITHGNASGETINCIVDSNTPTGCGGGIFVYQADPIIQNNIISYNTATSVDKTLTKGYGGGIYSVFSNNISIKNNTLIGNMANQGLRGGEGGGIFLMSAGMNTRVTNNSFSGNYGSTSSSLGAGGAIRLGSSDTLVESNMIENNSGSNLGASSLGSAIYQHNGDAIYRDNTFANNHNGYAIYLENFGGIFEKNRILENNVTTSVYLLFSGESGFSFTNNIIASGETETDLLVTSGLIGNPLTADVKHNTIVGNGGSSGVSIEGYCTITMANNIVTNHATGVTLTGSNNTLTQNNTLFYGNTSSGESGINPVFGNPTFKNPTDSDYRIKGNSAARDAGIDAGITEDIEGTERPKGSGYDIGAYEFFSAINAGIMLMLLN